MGLRTLLTQPVTVLTASNGTADEYGNTSTTYSAGSGYLGRLEQRAAQEITEGRDTFTSDWVLYLFPNAVIAGRDRVVADGKTFEVLGQPSMERSPRGVHHIEANLRFVQ